MAVEVATLKPLFPGGNEVDQVWRVCEIMGSPGNWYSKSGARVGGGDWREGTKLAQKLGFSFPKVGSIHVPSMPIADTDTDGASFNGHDSATSAVASCI